MFTGNQIVILRLLVGAPDRAFTVSELGRLMGKAPGVFQRGLNALEVAGFITSRREANRRMVKINTAHPLYAAVSVIVRADSSPLPADIYMTYESSGSREALKVAEAPGIYETSTQKILIIAGPNGAGKTTFAREFLPHEAGCPIFINADYIAHGLSPFSPGQAAMKAGKVMLSEVADHIAHRRNVALETTLSGRRYAQLIPRWQAQGYAVKLIFLSLPSVTLALARVASRVRQGGHAIPEPTIQRRFAAGRSNFDKIYRPLVDAWALFDNSGDRPVLLEEDEK